MHKTTHKAKYYGRWLRVTAVSLLALILTTTLLIASGLIDPVAKNTNKITYAPTTLTLPPQEKQTVWQTVLPSPPYSVRLVAALQSGEIDSGYGFILGNEIEHLGVAVAPTGYLTVWQTGQQEEIFLPWQTWPHVQTGNMPNEIWLEMAADGLATIRVNRELLWSGEVDVPAGKFGLYGESFGETAVIDYQNP